MRGQRRVSGIWSGDMEKGETLKYHWSISAGQTEKISTWITEEDGQGNKERKHMSAAMNNDVKSFISTYQEN